MHATDPCAASMMSVSAHWWTMVLFSCWNMARCTSLAFVNCSYSMSAAPEPAPRGSNLSAVSSWRSWPLMRNWRQRPPYGPKGLVLGHGANENILCWSFNGLSFGGNWATHAQRDEEMRKAESGSLSSLLSTKSHHWIQSKSSAPAPMDTSGLAAWVSNAVIMSLNHTNWQIYRAKANHWIGLAHNSRASWKESHLFEPNGIFKLKASKRSPGKGGLLHLTVLHGTSEIKSLYLLKESLALSAKITLSKQAQHLCCLRKTLRAKNSSTVVWNFKTINLFGASCTFKACSWPSFHRITLSCKATREEGPIFRWVTNKQHQTTVHLWTFYGNSRRSSTTLNKLFCCQAATLHFQIGEDCLGFFFSTSLVCHHHLANQQNASMGQNPFCTPVNTQLEPCYKALGFDPWHPMAIVWAPTHFCIFEKLQNISPASFMAV